MSFLSAIFKLPVSSSSSSTATTSSKLPQTDANDDGPNDETSTTNQLASLSLSSPPSSSSSSDSSSSSSSSTTSSSSSSSLLPSLASPLPRADVALSSPSSSSPAPTGSPSPSPSSPSSPSSPVASGYEYVCPLSSLPPDDRMCVAVNSRPIVLIRWKRKSSTPPSHNSPHSSARLKDGSEIFAIDGICYHMGVKLTTSQGPYHALVSSSQMTCSIGPLSECDIEEIGGSVIAICPWHHYHISCETGEGLYQALGGGWKSKGIKQRVHHVVIYDQSIYVRVSTSTSTDASGHSTGKLDSDLYCDRPVTVAEIEAKEEKRKRRGNTKKFVPSGLSRGTLF